MELLTPSSLDFGLATMPIKYRGIGWVKPLIFIPMRDLMTKHQVLVLLSLYVIGRAFRPL